MDAIQEEGEIEDEDDEEEEIPAEEIDYPDAAEFIKIAKIKEMSAICRKTIEAGFDLELQGIIHHFSLTT